tara:strand:- start:308 stop:610 length:303 start_codon:yes stop_codon:yes gene_type:complete
MSIETENKGYNTMKKVFRINMIDNKPALDKTFKELISFSNGYEMLSLAKKLDDKNSSLIDLAFQESKALKAICKEIGKAKDQHKRNQWYHWLLAEYRLHS